MRSAKVFLFSFLLAATDCFSQPETTSDITDITKLTIINPGISYEKRIAKLQSLNFHAGLSFSAYYSYSDALGTSSGINYYPALGIGYRYYYNATRRIAKGRRTEINSMNYLGPIHESLLQRRLVYNSVNYETRLQSIHTLGVIWGMQRNYPKHFSLDAHVGLGYVYGNADVFGRKSNNLGERLTIITSFDIGFWLKRRK